MDELLLEFLSETGENLDTVDRELVRFEQEPNNREILRNIFRLVHTVKGTCGFIGLPRLEALTHAAESVIGQFRDGATVSATAVTAILETIDRVKEILAELAEKGQEPSGNDQILIAELAGMAERAKRERAASRSADQDPVEAYLSMHGEPVTEEGLDLLFRKTGPDQGDTPADVAARPHPEEAPLARENKTVPVATSVPTLRVNVETLEHLMTMVSELVLTRNQLLEIVRRQDDTALKAPLQRLSVITAELQDGVMKTRMQPIGNAWSKLPRIVRDLCGDLGKRIDLIMDGADTELDRQLLDLVKDPLTHMVRNCADHGIETLAERRAAGKPEHGTIRVAAYHEGGSVTISVSDDGRGLDFAGIRRKAVQAGLADADEIQGMSDEQLSRFIFHPGFSTSASVTAVSGRGVGMDVVKANVDVIGGTIEVASRPGQGTTVVIKIPLTLAIVAALIVVSGEQRFAIPQIVVRELVRVKTNSEHRIETINGTPVLRLRDRLLPIVTLADLMGAKPASVEDGFIVVTQIGERQFGVMVDSVFHTEEIVVKPLSSKLRHISIFSGNTILGDGAVVLIVDPNGIARIVNATMTSDVASAEADAPLMAEAAERTTMLVFRAGSDSVKALPLSLVTRLEEVAADQFETGGGRILLNYRGRLIPVIPVGQTQIRTQGLQPLVIVSENQLTLALAVEHIVDIVDDVLEIEFQSMLDPGVIGSAVIRGRATEILDLAHYLPQGHAGWTSGRDLAPSGSRQRILLVEPSEFLTNMLSPVLKASGRTLAHATDFDAARRAAAQGQLSDVLVDLDRNPERAFAFVRELRAGDDAAGLRIIGMTTCATPELAAMAKAADLDLVVPKFDRRGLLAGLTEFQRPTRRAA